MEGLARFKQVIIYNGDLVQLNNWITCIFVFEIDAAIILLHNNNFE